ncbi:MAG: hypothetical protein KAI51_03770 [Candidatus Aenigmarchaeota archaeon]|nr:hypothetical protein [Candidatus Aenigmarchaeota archaeon]
MDVSEAMEIISRMFNQKEAEIVSEYDEQMKELDDARYRIEKEYNFLEDMIALYNIDSSGSLLLLRRNPIYTMASTEIDNILSVNPFLNMRVSVNGLYAEFREVRDGSVHLVLKDELSFAEDYDLSPSIPAFEGRPEDDARTDPEKYSPLRLDSTRCVTLLPFLDEVFSYIGGLSCNIEDMLESMNVCNLEYELDERKISETFRQINEIADGYHSSLDDVYLHEGEIHIKLSGDFSESNKFFRQYMPEGKGSFNPVFFMKPEYESGLYVVRSPELIPVGVPDSDSILVPA